jgi:Zn-dependent protease with chaperone function
MNEDKASRYHRLVRRACGVELLWSAALLVFLLVSHGSAVLRDHATSVAAAIGAPDWVAPAVVVAIYVMLLAVVHECVPVVIEYYRGHVLEARYGLSTQSTGRWLRTYVKASLIGLAFAQTEGCVLYISIRRWPERWWIVAATTFSLLMISLAKAGPVLLLPLFYEFKRIERDALQQRLIDLAKTAGTSVLGVYGWTLSDSTRKANAALVGIGGTRRILLSDTLLANYSDDEMEVVLAHELAHHVHGDIWRSLAFNTGLIFVSFYAAHRLLPLIGPSVGVVDPADVAGLPFVVLVFGMLSLVILPLANALSRRHERRADGFALQLTRNPSAFASVMRRLAQQNLAEDQPSRVVQTLFYNHPPFVERLQMAREWEAQNGALV